MTAPNPQDAMRPNEGGEESLRSSRDPDELDATLDSLLDQLQWDGGDAWDEPKLLIALVPERPEMDPRGEALAAVGAAIAVGNTAADDGGDDGAEVLTADSIAPDAQEVPQFREALIAELGPELARQNLVRARELALGASRCLAASVTIATVAALIRTVRGYNRFADRARTMAAEIWGATNAALRDLPPVPKLIVEHVVGYVVLRLMTGQPLTWG